MRDQTSFEKFTDLARRILTTPKAELLKHAPPKKTTKNRAKKKK